MEICQPHLKLKKCNLNQQGGIIFHPAGNKRILILLAASWPGGRGEVISCYSLVPTHPPKHV